MPGGVPYPKSEQLKNTPGRNRFCPTSGALHEDCDCPASRSRVRNQNNRLSGLKAQRKAGRQLAKGLGVAPGRVSNEETTTWPIRWEAKSGRVAEPVVKFYEACKGQADAATPIGSFKPFVAVADTLAVLELDDFQRLLNEAKRGAI